MQAKLVHALLDYDKIHAENGVFPETLNDDNSGPGDDEWRVPKNNYIFEYSWNLGWWENATSV